MDGQKIIVTNRAAVEFALLLESGQFVTNLATTNNVQKFGKMLEHYKANVNEIPDSIMANEDIRTKMKHRLCTMLNLTFLESVCGQNTLMCVQSCGLIT